MTEEPYMDSEEDYKDFCDNANDLMQSVTPEARFRYVNNVWLRTLGYKKQEVANMTIFNIIHPDELEHCQQLFKEVMSGEDVGPVNTTFVTKGGDKVFVEGNVNCKIVDGKPVYTRMIFRNITERKKVEKVLKESEETFRTFMETASDTMHITDKDGKFTWVNESMSRTFGYSKEEIIGMHITQFLTKKTVESTFESKTKELLTKGELSFEDTWIAKDGRKIYGELKVIAFYDSDGKYAGSRGVFRDLTERKRAEDKTKELYKREKKLHERVGEEMRKQVEFTRAMVHELKTPLTSVMAAIELLADGVEEEQMPRLVGSISRGAYTMNNRIDTLIDLVKGEMNMLELNYGEVELLRLLHRIADEMNLVASNSGLSLVTDLPSSLPLVMVDESRLEEVVLNLLTNAFKWSKEGGKVILRAREKDAALIVEIQDEGAGIAKENQQNIFKPYYRVGVESRVVGGLGLGLALCKTIVEAHDGKIWVESEEGRGSIFSFSVPLRAAVD